MTSSEWLIFTTIPHLACCLIAPDGMYRAIVFQSTALSVLWHASNLPGNSYLGILDHAWALLWAVMDLWYAKTHYAQNSVLIWNYYIILLSKLVHELAEKQYVSYTIGHSIWHIVSAIKSLYITWLIQQS